MPQVILCKYCSRPNEISQLVCESCGPPLPHSVPENASQQPAEEHNLAESLLAICRLYEDVAQFYSEGAIPEKKLVNARQSLEIPEGERVLMLCDSTVFGSSKTGFAICEGGIYWNNDWATPTKRKRLNWVEFAERQARIDKFAIDLERGDKIDLAALGGNKERQQALRLLQEIRSSSLSS